MSTAFGIFLFVLVYAPVAYMIYDDMTGRRSPLRSLLARVGRHEREPRRPQLAGRYQQ
jgi:hypothetical protein